MEARLPRAQSYSELNQSLRMFSTLTLTGAHIPNGVSLSRRESFPARQYDFDIEEIRNRPDWVAAEVPQNCGQLSLELGERIGGGRSSVVYAAKLVAATSGKHGDPRTDDPHIADLCVKVARPNRCRSLAREAWVYEQLPESTFQGTVTPRCYGFFATELGPEQLPFPLWSSEDYYLDASPRHWKSDDSTSDDRLYDDRNEDQECTDSPPGARELSPWLDWHPNPKTPLLSVLVMARGGRHFTLAEDDWDQSNHEDIVQMLDDFSLCYIIHVDLRPANIIHAPPNTRLCPVHKCVHKWNIIDFAWSVVEDPRDQAKFAIICDMQRAKWRNRYFMSARH